MFFALVLFPWISLNVKSPSIEFYLKNYYSAVCIERVPVLTPGNLSFGLCSNILSHSCLSLFGTQWRFQSDFTNFDFLLDETSNWNSKFKLGGSPGLVVIGEDSCSRGCGLKCQHLILGGHHITLIWWKRGWDCQYFFKNFHIFLFLQG